MPRVGHPLPVAALHATFLVVPDPPELLWFSASFGLGLQGLTKTQILE